jgi:hypothetical protein
LTGASTGYQQSGLAGIVDETLRTDVAGDAVRDGDGLALSYLVGVTEADLDASALTLPTRILDRLDAGGALTCVTAAGHPNTGKSNTMFLLADLARAYWDDLLVVSNVASWSGTDVLVQSMHELLQTLLDHRHRPKVVVVDEGSTHFDARTRSREVGHQWSPAVKRMSKLGVEVVGVIGHTGKDVHPEQKRLTSLAFYKTAPDRATFFEKWPSDSERPAGELFGGDLVDLEPTLTEYDPDDASPWEWNLDPDVFNRSFGDWDEFAAILDETGPT